MSKKNAKPQTLNFSDIVLGADAETIREALEARIEIDRLLEERAKAYEQIAELESRVEDLLGDDDEFPFPEPPAPVFGYGPKGAKKKARKASPATRTAPPANNPTVAPESPQEDQTADSEGPASQG